MHPEIGRDSPTILGHLQVARDFFQKVKSRGVTRFCDLTVKKKCDIDDFGSGDDIMDNFD